jgi:hypothetical protein
MKTTLSTVTFRHPFVLEAADGPQPAGTYRLVIDQEEILGLSFVSYRRLATWIHLPALSVSELPYEVLPISPDELDAAIAADKG